jgi:hypothetical protein
MFAAAVLVATGASSQEASPDIAEQREAISALDFLDGEWAGKAKGHTPAGSIDLVQTERVGSLLGGTLKLIEGRAYDASGATVFNALAVISYDAKADKYLMRSYAQGRVTDADFVKTAEGFEWGFSSGPARMRFRAKVQNGRWVETGTLSMPGRPDVTTAELDLERKSATDWPRGKAVEANAFKPKRTER